MTSGQSNSGYTVVISELRTHAGVLDQVAGTLGQALGAARQSALSDAAFGQLPVSAAFAGLVRAAATPGVDALSQAQTTVSSMGTAMTGTAANYDEVEHSNAAKFQTGGAR